MSLFLTAEEYLKRTKAGEKPFKLKECTCSKCSSVLDYLDKEGNYKIDGEFVCADCYFGALGDEVEKHPIGRPTRHGGCT